MGNDPRHIGFLYCWGANGAGQLGDGTTTDRNVPVPVQGVVDGSTAPLEVYDPYGDVVGANINYQTSIAAGGFTSGNTGFGHTCAVVPSYQGIGYQYLLYCWGYNGWGQLGLQGPSGQWSTVDQHVPAPLPEGGWVAGPAIATGAVHTCSITTSANGTLDCWGANGAGQVAVGGPNPEPAPTQAPYYTAMPYANPYWIAAGAAHTCAVTDFEVDCWGDNSLGQLGSGSFSPAASVNKVTGLGGANGVTGFAAGGWHTCAIVGGGIQCWGYGGWGSLGNNDNANSPTPVTVVGF
jgi:alpha-tubulin suppressor-like RCC1 family protein